MTIGEVTMKDQMRAAVYNKVGDYGQLTVMDRAVPRVVNPDDVLIRVEAISICGTDTRALAKPPVFDFADNIVIGHEFAGIVEGIGSAVTGVALGDKVVVHPNIWCGKCEPCRTGHINLCENFLHIGDRIDGGMAEYVCVPERMAYKISNDVPSYIACLAEPLACILNGTNTVKAHPGEDVVILGGGPIGLLFAMIYKASGARVIVSDTIPYRREKALEIGADAVIDPISQDLKTEVRKVTGSGANIIVDCVGMLLPDAVSVAKKGAHILLFGINQVGKVQLNQYPMIEKELTIHGTYIAKGTFPQAVRIIENKTIPIEKLVTHRMPLDDAMKGIELMQGGQSLKVVIEI